MIRAEETTKETVKKLGIWGDLGYAKVGLIEGIKLQVSTSTSKGGNKAEVGIKAGEGRSQAGRHASVGKMKNLVPKKKPDGKNGESFEVGKEGSGIREVSFEVEKEGAWVGEEDSRIGIEGFGIRKKDPGVGKEVYEIGKKGFGVEKKGLGLRRKILGLRRKVLGLGRKAQGLGGKILMQVTRIQMG